MSITYVRYADGGNQIIYWVEDEKVFYLNFNDPKVVKWISDGNEIIPFNIEPSQE